MGKLVAIVESNESFARSIEEKLETFSDDVRCKFRAKDGTELLTILADDSAVDAVLIDIEAPALNGLGAANEIKIKYPWIGIIVLTASEDEDTIIHAIRSGASGYLLKKEPVEKIVEGIRVVAEGGVRMSGSVGRKALCLLRSLQLDNIPPSQPEIGMSKREIEVLKLLRQGFDYKEIAVELCVSPSTVRKHIENIYRKLEVHNKMQAVQKALREKIIL